MGRPGAAAVASPVISRRQVWALVALTLMWGVNWPMMKLSLRELTPMYFRALTMTGGDCHIYSNHAEQVALQLSREPLPYPTLRIKRRPESIFDYEYEDFEVLDYQSHPPIKAPVAI